MNNTEFLKLRKKLFGTQTAAANQLGYGRSTLRTWEAGVMPVPKIVALYMADLAIRPQTQKEIPESVKMIKCASCGLEVTTTGILPERCPGCSAQMMEIK